MLTSNDKNYSVDNNALSIKHSINLYTWTVSYFDRDTKIDSWLVTKAATYITTVNAIFTNEQIEPYLHMQHSY